jgi:hypothetical protein
MTEHNEQFADISTLVGIRSDTAEEPQEVDTQEIETDDSMESDEPEQVDASEDEPVDDDGVEADSEEDEGESEESDIEALKIQLEEKEQQRRDWQSKAMQSDDDNQKLLDALSSKSTAPASDKPEVGSQALEKLAALSNDEVVDAGTLKEVIQDFFTSQQTSTQKQKLNDLVRQVDEAVSAKPDVDKVQDFYKQNRMNRDRESGLLNDLGNFYRAENAMLKEQLKKAREKGKVDGAKEQIKRQAKLKAIPPVSGAKGANASGSVSIQDDPSGILNRMMQRRKSRGIRTDGSIR